MALLRMFTRRQLASLATLGMASSSWASQKSAPLVVDIIDIEPWGRRTSDGEVGGVYTEIFQRLGEISGYTLEMRLTPIKRAVAEVTRGFSQATMMLERADLNTGAIVIGTVTNLEIEVWLPAASKIRSLEQLSGKTVATLRGPAYHEEFDANDRIAKIPVTGAKQQLEMIRAGRVDGALGVRQNFLVALRDMGLKGDSFADPIWLGSRRVLLWISPGMRGTDFANRMARALHQLRSSGEIDRVMSRRVYAGR